MRGKVYGILELTMPLGFLLGDGPGAGAEEERVGWRGVFYITGTLGVVLAAVIFFGVREPKRGGSEPEMAGVEQVRPIASTGARPRRSSRKRSLRLIFVQGFFGVFPWNVITFWFFTYLETERGYAGTTLFVTMAAAVLVLAAGYPLGGALGDALFKRNPRGRLIVAAVGVLTGAILLPITLACRSPIRGLFLLMLALTALFIPFAAPNIIATVYDVTLPEVRSTALSIQSFIEWPARRWRRSLAGVIADRSSLQDAILLICVSTWILCRDLLRLRRSCRAGRYRGPARADARAAEHEEALQTGAASADDTVEDSDSARSGKLILLFRDDATESSRLCLVYIAVSRAEGSTTRIGFVLHFPRSPLIGGVEHREGAFMPSIPGSLCC